jgi:PPOX class probable F420-dependent enzyme
MPKGYGVPADDQGMLPWSHLQQRMAQSRHYWVSTIRPDGRPHATPVWGVWLDGVLYIEGGPDTRRGRNIEANPSVAVHLESGEDVVIVEGEAHMDPNPDQALTARLAEAFGDKYAYANYRPDPKNWQGGGLYAIRPHVAIAWTKFPRDATRWTFEG